MSTPLSELEAQRERLKQQLSGLGDLRPGSLVERYRKCGKPNCHCAAGEGHPSLYLVQNEAGKARQWCVPKALHDPVRHAVGEYQKIQRLMDEVSELEWKRLQGKKT